MWNMGKFDQIVTAVTFVNSVIIDVVAFHEVIMGRNQLPSDQQKAIAA
ncbi:hypothetical protein GCM10007941_12130 [Amphritea balenae]|nr:hypothetical protein GCM10007941_12130 [Amphritea balenae]